MKVKSESEVAQPCLTLPSPMDCSLPGSSIRGIFQATVLEWVAIGFSNIYTIIRQIDSCGNLLYSTGGSAWCSVGSGIDGEDIYTMEYYSAIKRNAFESVLMRWVNLEPIIQSEGSQKEKDKYQIIMHIYRI